MTEVVAAGRLVAWRWPRLPRGHGRLHGADLRWSIAFVAPYAALFAAFAVYPMIYALWMGSDPALFAELFFDPRYLRAAINTVLFVGFAVNLQMVAALFLSGFFMRRRWWIKALLVINLAAALFGIEGPFWFNHGWLALACDIVADVWKWLPLWTLILLGGRMAIPQDLYDAADVDGASAWQRFAYVTMPLLASLYVVSTLISAIWTFGDYSPVLFVSAGTPAFESEVVSTLGFHYALDFANPPLAVAAGLSLLPLLVPLMILVIRRLQRIEVQL